MHIIGKIPRWLVERDPCWERIGKIESSLPEWTKKGSDLRAKCGPEDLYCEITIEDRYQSFVSSESMLSPSVANVSTSPESDLKRYLSSRYLNPGFYTNSLGLPRTRKLW
jgi:hypothetical protein